MPLRAFSWGLWLPLWVASSDRAVLDGSHAGHPWSSHDLHLDVANASSVTATIDSRGPTSPARLVKAADVVRTGHAASARRAHVKGEGKQRHWSAPQATGSMARSAAATSAPEGAVVLEVSAHGHLTAHARTLQATQRAAGLSRETAGRENPGTRPGTGLAAPVLCVCAVCAVLLWYWGHRVLSRWLKATIETFDKRLLGVKVGLGSVELLLCRGRLLVRNLAVSNPEGYRAEHLLRAKRIVVSVNSCKLLCSRGRDVRIDRLEVSDVDITYEKALSSSNVDALLSFISAGGGAPEPAAPSGGAGGRKVTLRKVVVERVRVKVAAQALAGAGVQLPAAGVGWQDFSAEVGDATPGAMTVIILRKVLETALAAQAPKGKPGAPASAPRKAGQAKAA
mmetsp:Transcript_86130/g.278722  ORF Transcript_86130/g.278722 Transcript_86130/m.278722 type:complete len:395 (+) Transcript_86130:97-1281(+)